MSKAELSLVDLEVGSVVIRIDGLLHFYSLKSEIRVVHAYVDESRQDCKYTIDVLLENGEVTLQYSDKELSASVLGMFERVLCVSQAKVGLAALFEHEGMRNLMEFEAHIHGFKKND